MTKYIFLAVLFAVACDSKKPDSAPAQPEPVYATNDTVRSTTPASVVLTRDGVVVDTIDGAFGAQPVGFDSVLFRSTPRARYELFDGHNRTVLNTIVPDFDDALSAPSIIEGAVLYWGIHSAGGVDSVRAVRYEFRRRRLNPLPVPAKLNRSATGFTPPYLDGKEIVFKATDGEWRFRTPKQ